MRFNHLHYRSAIFRQEPQWQQPHQLFTHPGATEHDWLYESGSLTRRLKQIAGAGFGVSLQQQHWQRASLNEQRILHIPHQQYALVREVKLQQDQTALVLARTVIPLSMLRGAQRHLLGLGTRPLGEVIFSKSGLQRTTFEIARLSAQHFKPKLIASENKKELSVSHAETAIWARRTCYQLEHQPILISEIFLPALFKLEASV